MKTDATRTAVIIGASSGIGEALAHELNRDGWHLMLMARRVDRLNAIRDGLTPETLVRAFDVCQPDAAARLESIFDEIGSVDLVIIAAGSGHNNHHLDWAPDAETVTANVLGFMAVAQAALRWFLKQGHGHLVGISSIAALRGNAAGAAYAASKAFQSVYLDGLRELAGRSGLPIAVTEIQPGGVDTAMFKPDRPVPPVVRRLFVASPATAANQIVRAIRRRAKHVYVTRRYALVAIVLRCLPRPG